MALREEALQGDQQSTLITVKVITVAIISISILNSVSINTATFIAIQDLKIWTFAQSIKLSATCFQYLYSTFLHQVATSFAIILCGA